MACTFTIALTDSADATVAKAKQKVEENNGTFTGDSGSGSFDVPIPLGHISGNYTIEAQQITIDITHKDLVPCSTIESFARNNL